MRVEMMEQGSFVPPLRHAERMDAKQNNPRQGTETLSSISQRFTATSADMTRRNENNPRQGTETSGRIHGVTEILPRRNENNPRQGTETGRAVLFRLCYFVSGCRNDGASRLRAAIATC